MKVLNLQTLLHAVVDSLRKLQEKDLKGLSHEN